MALLETSWLHRIRLSSGDVTAAAARTETEATATIRADREVEEQIRLAESELAQLPRQIPAALEAEKAATDAWLARVKQLQAAFRSNLALGIPEMRLLTDADWLKVAATASLETDEDLRKAEGEIRSAAKDLFARSLATALDKYTAATQGALPLTVLELENYGVPPLDRAMLARYAMARSGNISDGIISIAINEISPVDAQFDSRIRIQTQGGESVTEPPAWGKGR